MSLKTNMLIPVGLTRCAYHTPMKLGYLAWHAWAEQRAAEGAKQVQCPTCKLWHFPEEIGAPSQETE